jgi:hypothetical protein
VDRHRRPGRECEATSLDPHRLAIEGHGISREQSPAWPRARRSRHVESFDESLRLEPEPQDEPVSGQDRERGGGQGDEAALRPWMPATPRADQDRAGGRSHRGARHEGLRSRGLGGEDLPEPTALGLRGDGREIARGQPVETVGQLHGSGPGRRCLPGFRLMRPGLARASDAHRIETGWQGPAVG